MVSTTPLIYKTCKINSGKNCLLAALENVQYFNLMIWQLIRILEYFLTLSTAPLIACAKMQTFQVLDSTMYGRNLHTYPHSSF